MHDMIPMLDLKLEYRHMQSAIDGAIARCLEHQQWILGPEVKELEAKVASFLQAGLCVGASSGTEAIVLSLRALAILRTGKEFFDPSQQIITTAFTFTATGDAILRSGATPVFVDIDPKTFNIDAALVRKYLEENPGRVVGLLPVHLYGRSCDMDELLDLARKHGLFVVEDVAQAFGATWRGRKLGTLGDAGAFSFFPSKNLGGFGDGGMVSTNDEGLAAMVRMLLKHGGRDKYNVDHVGYNARLDTLQAAVLLAKLGYLQDFNDRRRRIAALYDSGLTKKNGIVVPMGDDPGHVYHQYTIRVEGGRREALQTHLKENRVASMVYYPYPLHKMKVFGQGRCITAGTLTHTEQACAEVLSLPMEPLMDEATVQRVVDVVAGWA
jgi:dTDP-4-amino-4,6-dideoxygalactose transaminase